MKTLIKQTCTAFRRSHSTELVGAHENAYLRQVLAFNAEKFSGSRDPSHAPIWINLWGHVRTAPGNTCAKFEARSFNRF